MNNLDKNIEMFKRNGFDIQVADAPKDAATFDKMIILSMNKAVRQVIFYNTKKNVFVATF